MANEYYQLAKNFADSSNFDSCLFYYKKAGKIYYTEKYWQKCIDCYNEIGRNLTNMQLFEEAEFYLNKPIYRLNV